MALSPLYRGKTNIAWQPQLTDDDGNPIFLGSNTVSDLMLRMVEKYKGIVKVCVGPWTILDIVNGIVEYQWQTSDLDTVGTWLLYVTLAGRPFDPETVEVRDAPN